MEPKIQQWVKSVNKLSKYTQQHPQSAYTGLSKSLQMEWQYLQRVVPNAGPAFAPIETALHESFLPALFGSAPGTCPDDSLRKLFALPA